LTWNEHTTLVQEGDLVQLVGLTHKTFIVRLQVGGALHTHRGVVSHDDIIGRPWGSEIASHQGNPFYVLQPGLNDLLKAIPRNTQILYAKDIGYILFTMGIGPGMHVLEAGTGSGALTSALAYLVGPAGRVTSYEMRNDMHQLARKNLARFGLEERVDLKLQNIADGITERDVDAIFLDLPNPFDYVHLVSEALKPGGYFGSILPTTNQVTRLLTALRRYPFAFVDVCEVILRFYKPDSDKFRPVDRMVAHTGFLIFARKIVPLLAEGLPPELREAEQPDFKTASDLD
jgi:tRNA (adenine57-N1/adenine58-N1)-methyltransferase